jgi:proline racemase
MVHSSLIGSRFRGRILADSLLGERPAILPAISGRAWITGFHHYVLDADDPFPQGYVLNDTWGVGGSLVQ